MFLSEVGTVELCSSLVDAAAKFRVWFEARFRTEKAEQTGHAVRFAEHDLFNRAGYGSEWTF